MNRSSDWLVGRIKFFSTKFSYFLNSFYFKNKDLFLFFVKLGYVTCFFFYFLFLIPISFPIPKRRIILELSKCSYSFPSFF